MKKNILKLMILLIALFLSLQNVDAASFSVSSSSTNMTKGGSATLTIKGSDVTGRFNISTSDASVIAISEDRAWIENNSYKIKLSALNTGSATITITPSGVSDENGNTVSLGAKSLKINVNPPRVKSKDNYLKGLSIEGYEITPEFDKSVQVYSAVIPEGTESINVKASANESHAKVRGAGSIKLTEEVNTVNIIVKAETGDERIYTINLDIKDNNPITTTVNGEEYTVVKIKEQLTKPETFEETTITINDFEIPAFINNNVNLTLVGLKNANGDISLFIYKDDNYTPYNELSLTNHLLIPLPLDKKLDYEKTTVTINNNQVEAYKYDEKGDFVIINAQNLEDGSTSLYLYDTKSNTVIHYDDIFIKNTPEEPKIKNYSYIFIGFIGILALMLIIILSLLFTIKKKQKKINKFIANHEAKQGVTTKLNNVLAEVKAINDAEKKNQIKKENKELSKNNKEIEKESKKTEKEKTNSPKKNEKNN